MAEETTTPTGEGENLPNQSTTGADEAASLEQETPEQIAAEEFVKNFKEEDWADPEQVTKLQEAHKALKTTIAQKNHWRTKATDKTKTETPAPTVPNPQGAAAPTSVTDQSTEQLQRIGFRQDHPDLPKEAVDEVFLYAKAHKMDPEEALKRPAIQSYVQTLKNNAAIAGASPKPSGPSKIDAGAVDWGKADSKTVNATREQIMRNANRRS